MKKVFYGWINVAVSVVIMSLLLGLGNATLSLFIKPMADTLQVSRTAVSTIVSISAITIGLASMLCGTLSKRFGFKKVIMGGIVFMGAAAWLYSMATALWMIYAAAILFGLGITFGTTITISAVIQNWFVEKKGLALGIVFASSGVGGMIFNPIVAGLIESSGWQSAFRFEAIAMLVIPMLAALFISNKPADKGEKAYGESSSAVNLTESDNPGLSLGQARKTKSFKLLILTVLLYSFAVQPLLYIVPAHYSDLGFDASFGATLLSVIYLVNIFAKIIIGVLNDKFGVRLALSTAYASFFAAILFILIGKSTAMGYGFAMFYGIAFALLVIPMPLIIPLLFGTKDYSTIMGVLTAFATAGSAIGMPISSLSYDLTGSYTYAFIGLAVAMVVSYISFIASLKAKPDFVQPSPASEDA